MINIIRTVITIIINIGLLYLTFFMIFIGVDWFEGQDKYDRDFYQIIQNSLEIHGGKAPTQRGDDTEGLSEGRYSPLQGFSEGQKVAGITIEGFRIPVITSYDILAKENEETRYRKAKDDAYNNTVFYFGEVGNVYLPVPYSKDFVEEFNRGEGLFDHWLFNQYVVQYINNIREREGVGPLYVSERLYTGAYVRAQELARYGNATINNIPHVRPDGTGFETAFSGIGVREIGENTFIRQTSGNPYEMLSEQYLAEVVVYNLMESPTHYQNMINPNWKSMATGLALTHSNGASQELDEFATYYIANQVFEDQ